MSAQSATSTEKKEASDISTASGAKGLEATGGVEGALAKEREARGAAKEGESAHAQDSEGPGSGHKASN